MKILYFFLLIFLLAAALPAQESTTDERLKKLEQMLLKMQNELKLKDKKIEKLENKLNNLSQESPKKPAGNDEELLDQLIEADNKGTDNKKEKADDHSHHNHHNHQDSRILRLGDSVDRVMDLIDISTVINMAAGASSFRNSELEEYQGGGHDPKERGFNFQQMELVLSGAVDDLFDYEGHIIFLEDDVELEEAFIRTRSLPGNLQVKGGLFLTEFGIVNQQHLHSWDFIDQPIINSRLFGGDGMRGPGVSLSWLTPLPWYSELIFGVQNSDGDNMISFRGEGHAHGHEHEEEEKDERFEEAVGGRPYTDRDTRNLDDLVWLARWVNTFDISKSTTLQVGVSNLIGENHTGGNTWIYGADLKLVIDNDPELGRPNWIWQTEIIKREYSADSISVDETNPGDMDNFTLPSADIDDWGLYTQLIKAIDKKWSAGLRFEYVSGDGTSFEGDEIVDRDDDFQRSDRFRISPLITYQHSEFTKFRLQYNYDDSDAEGTGDTVWLGVEVLLGKHPAHKF